MTTTPTDPPGLVDSVRALAGNLLASIRDRVALLSLELQEERSPMMNRDVLSGNWKQLKGKIKQQWGKLTDDDLDVIEGKKDVLIGKIQERYGKGKEEAERDVDDFMRRGDFA